MDTQSLDPGSLNRLRDLGAEIGNERFLEQMAEIYLESLPPIDTLRQKLGEADRKAVGDMAHSLRGNSASFGALRLAELAADLESRAERDELAEPWPRWQDFADEYERVDQELRRLLAS